MKDLIADLKYELTGKFERLVVSLMRPPAYHDAKEIKDAIKVRKYLTTTAHPSTASETLGAAEVLHAVHVRVWLVFAKKKKKD